MNTLSLNHSSHLRIGIATVSAALLTLLGGLAANAQSPSQGAGQPLPLPGQAIPKPTPLTLQQMQAAHPANARPLFLPPAPNPKHPITASVRLADPSVLAGPPTVLAGHVPGLTAFATKQEPLPPDQELTITFFLRPRNKEQMDALVKRLYDPKDPQFHHFLKPAERIERFSPAQEDFNKVAAFAQRSGLQVTDSAVSRRWLQATGTVSQIESALGVHLDNYKAEDGTAFYAPDTDPKVPQGIASVLTCIEQLNNIKPHSNAIFRPAPRSGGAGGTGGGIQPDDIGIWNGIGMPAAEIKDCYQLAYTVGSTPLNGTGQRVALVEVGGYDLGDINYYVYYNDYLANPTTNLAYTPLQLHGVDQGTSDEDNAKECELDIEMLEAVADGLSQIDVYESFYGPDVTLNYVLDDDADNQVSISIGASEYLNGPILEGAFIDTTEEMALQGQAVFVASGDWGSTNWKSSSSTTGTDVNYYAVSPFVTAVGGTTLWVNETNNYGAYSYESSWCNGIYATGGGISQYVSIPDYQYNLLANDSYLSTVQASLFNRNIPDVALDADPNTGYYTHLLGKDMIAGGTSASTPLWAGFWAQLNQYRALYGISPIGIGNPALYSIAGGSNYNTDFHDVSNGYSNGYNYQGGYLPYYGYDLTTGLGSLVGINLIYDLVNSGSWSPSESFSVSPANVTSGNYIKMKVFLNPPAPGTGSAMVVWAQVIGNVAYQVGTTSLLGGADQGAIDITAPDVKTATSETYICYVIYYDSYGKQRGGAYWSNEASTTVYPNTLASASVSGPAYDGQSVTGTITLVAPAAQNEQIDLVSSDPTHALVPASVTVQAGQQSAKFTINTKVVTASEQVTITANPDTNNSGLGSGSASAQLTVSPLLSSVKLSPASVTGSLTTTCTIHLLAPAPSGGAVITLKSGNSAASVPASVTIPAGFNNVSFSISTSAVSSTVSGKITATHIAAVKSANLKVLPVGVGSVTLNPTSVVGGGSVSGKVTLAAPAAPGSITVSLASNMPSVASPTVTSITIPAGSQTGTFTVQTNKVSATTLVSITATANGIKKSKTLKVTP